MGDQLTDRTNASPSGGPNGPDMRYVERWIDLMNTCEQFLLAGLRREIGPDGDLKAAYRRWYAERMEERDREWLQMKERFERLGEES